MLNHKIADEVEQKAAGLEQHKLEFEAYQCFSGQMRQKTCFKDSVLFTIAT